MKRKDNKGRILRSGESQRKDGRYVYKYTDVFGKQQFVYSWRLTEKDVTPPRKKDEPPLREKIKGIQRAIDNEIIPLGGNLTMLELVRNYILTKTGVKDSTKVGYNYVMNILKKEAFAKRRIDTIHISDAKKWFIKLQDKDGRGYSTIHTIRGVVRPAFQMAMDDDLIKKNPFEFKLASVVINNSVMREAISRQMMRDYLAFVKNDSHFSKYYEGIYILFKTGLRISEFTGLTLSDIDFKNKKLRVERQLIRNINMELKLQDTKTISGRRTIPLTDDVLECFRTIVKNRKTPKVEPMVNGKAGFLYFDKLGNPMVALHWEKYMQHIKEKHNKIYKEQWPDITPHVCRHTYCSIMAHSGMNPKTLQYLMGHADIGVTLNTYTHLTYENAEEEVKRLGSVN